MLLIKTEISDKWRALQGSIQTYRERLAVAGAVHSFQRDTDETLARIKAKLLIVDVPETEANGASVSASNVGRDLAEV